MVLLYVDSVRKTKRQALFASHASVEPAHRMMLAEINLKPMLELEMRLGEGTGAALAFPIIEIATKIQLEMATLESLGIGK